MSHTWQPPQQNDFPQQGTSPMVPAQAPPPPPGAWQPPSTPVGPPPYGPPPVGPRPPQRRNNGWKVVGAAVGVAAVAIAVAAVAGGGGATSPATPSTTAAAPATVNDAPASVDDSAGTSTDDPITAWKDAGGMGVLTRFESDLDDMGSAASAGNYSTLYSACGRLVADAQDGLALPSLPGTAGTSFDSAMRHFVAAGNSCQAGDIFGSTSELNAGKADIQAATAALPGAGSSS